MARLLLFIIIGSSFFSYSQTANRGGRASDVREEVKGEKRALIIGISDYQNDKLDLKVADDDARLFKNYLTNIEKISDDNIIYLENEQASAQAIYQGIDELIKVTQEGDEVYVYFAGHGDVVNRENKKVGFLLAHDVNGGRNYRGTDGVVALAALNDFVNQLTTIGANVVMALDACHSGFIYEEGAKTNMNTLSDGNNFVKTTKFLSCAPSQTSQEDVNLGHGYFTFYWVLGMMGAADIGAQDNQLKYGELDDFVYEEVASLTNYQQEPLVITSNRRRMFKKLVPETKEIALLAHGKSINLKDTLQFFRSTGAASITPSQLTPIEIQFKKLIEEWEEQENQSNAIALYKNAVDNKTLDGKQMSRMRFTLSRKLTSDANRLINLYISGPKTLPKGSEFLMESKKVRQAMELLDNDHPSHRVFEVSALFLEAYSYVRNEDYQNYPYAEKLLKRAVELEPRAAYVWNTLGLLANEDHRYQDAYTYYNKAIELIPTWAYPVNNLGVNYFDQNNYEEADDWFEEALNIDGDYVTARQNIGAVAGRQGYDKKEETVYLNLLETHPNNSTLFTNLANLEKEKGNLKAAERYYKLALEKFPEDVAVLDKYASFITNYDINYDNPESFLLKAIELQPGYAKTLATYADFLRQRQYSEPNAKRADSLYRLAIKKNPYYIGSYSGLGYLLHKKDDPAALEWFEKGVEANEQNTGALYNLANFKRYQLKDIDEAEQLYLKIIENNPYYLSAYKALSGIYEEQGKEDLSLELIQKYLENAGESPKALLLLGDTYAKLGNKELAIQQYRQCLQIDSSHTDAAGNLAYALIDQEDFASAIPYARQAIEQNPIKYDTATLVSSLSRKARTYKRQGNIPTMLSVYKLAYEVDPSMEKTAFDYARELYIQNKTDEAQSIASQHNTGDKVWKEKWLILKIKLSIDNSNGAMASQNLKELKNTASNVDPILELLTTALSDKDAAVTMKEGINAVYLNAARLKRNYSSKSIEIINQL